MAIKTILTCDDPGCKSELILDGPYHIIKEEMKAVGWTNRKVDDKWKIKCNNHRTNK